MVQEITERILNEANKLCDNFSALQEDLNRLKTSLQDIISKKHANDKKLRCFMKKSQVRVYEIENKRENTKRRKALLYEIQNLNKDIERLSTHNRLKYAWKCEGISCCFALEKLFWQLSNESKTHRIEKIQDKSMAKIKVLSEMGPILENILFEHDFWASTDFYPRIQSIWFFQNSIRNISSAKIKPNHQIIQLSPKHNILQQLLEPNLPLIHLSCAEKIKVPAAKTILTKSIKSEKLFFITVIHLDLSEKTGSDILLLNSILERKESLRKQCATD